MPNNRTRGNITLREKLKDFLKEIPSSEKFHINRAVMALSKLNKNYSITSARIANLLKEEDKKVRFIKSGVWMKL